MPDVIRILIADDHPLFRNGVRALLESVEGMEVAGEASTGEEAVAMAEACQPDLVLMDIQMPQLNGIEATRRIAATSPHIGIIMITMFQDDDSVFAAVRAGARGYLLKGSRQEELLRAIRSVANDEAIFSPGVAQRVMQYFTQRVEKAPVQGAGHLFPTLTQREYEVLELIAQRCSNAEIAARLVLSPKTVRNHVSNIYDKLHVADRAEAILAARVAGVGTRDE